MLGVIRKRDILLHPVVTVQSFGWRVFTRALMAGPNETFLSLVAEAERYDKARREVPELIDRAIRLELRAMHLYEALATRFASDPAPCRMFATLALQEGEHAEMLRMCRHAARRRLIDAHVLLPFAALLPRLEETMTGAEAFLHSDYGRLEAFRLALHLESSELNRVFNGIVEASSSEFIKVLAMFHVATRDHLEFLRATACSIETSLEDECQALIH